jgi:nucleoid-associated protein YgaU
MLNKNLALITLVIFAAGCGLETRTYVITKDRVGLDQGNGNAGCVMGKCPAAPAPKETTRKVYVLEITKPVPESEVQKIEANAVNAIAETTPTPPAPAEPAPSPEVVAPVVGELPGNISAQTYTVQKDDTLQKISKKLFGTYSKWYKIYKANKDKIQNPNVLRPGTVLTIPAIK